MGLPKPLLHIICLTVVSLRMPEVSAITGDSWCGTLMCVKATLNDSVVTYELRSLNQLGWMAVGFGTRMTDSPLVILWPNADGSVTLSQRQAPGQVQPTPVAMPPRKAILSTRNVDLMSESTPTLSFRIPRNNDTLQQLIWAFGVTRPDPDPSSTLEQHLDAGKLMLDLTKTIPSTTSSSPSETSTSSPTDTLIPDSPGNSQGPFRDPILAAHMVLSFIGFLVLLPSAALIARWGRTRTAAWFKVGSGASISVEKRTSAYYKRASGLLILGFALFSTKTGIDRDFELTPAAVRTLWGVWIVWVVFIPSAYFAGLKQLRKQFAQERLGWNAPTEVPLASVLATISRHRDAEEAHRRGRSGNALPDDGSHDVFSRRAMPSPGSNIEEMREVQRIVPISVQA
ncbi:hypothetical protein NLI96_g11400 [Meripilus lineatus]|uniref:DOMON domain-containing protein n=1 Tax=Meripilus lineatus TaxID=2056292 RepID=A0AAD5YDC2_9APHY|nr:hypothetical protein NLI96_g11400 [Physisporinus lineatus]